MELFSRPRAITGSNSAGKAGFCFSRESGEPFTIRSGIHLLKNGCAPVRNSKPTTAAEDRFSAVVAALPLYLFGRHIVRRAQNPAGDSEV